MDLKERLEQHRAEEQQLSWEGTFLDYFEIVKARPAVADLAHARVYNMIMNAGVKTGERGQKIYPFFSQDIFGLEKPLELLVEYFSSAARRLEVRKRILLLMGPVGGGKSTIVSLLKRGMERFSRSEQGAIYAIKGCPMHEDPLHLIPFELRDEIQREQGLYIEGDLCPACAQMVKEKYGGRIEDVMVQRIAFSEKNRIGIGTFTPSDPKSQDISELTGSVDLSTIGQFGSESDPRAYRFDGELNIANRGMMEFIEMLKCDEKFLYGLLTLSQEQNIKTGRFAMIYADEVIASHTNENEFNSFVNNKKNEALKDRMILIRLTELKEKRRQPPHCRNSVRPLFTEGVPAQMEMPVMPVERPATLYLNNEEVVTLQTTPAYLDDWAVGFLFGEGFIQNPAEIRRLAVDEDRGMVWVDLPGREGADPVASRQRYLTAGCGRGVTFSSLKDALQLKPVAHSLTVSAEALLEAVREMQANCPLYAETGGVHGVGLKRLDTGGLLVREDIGRHNALDKAIGAAFRAGWPFDRLVAVTSGRISYEAATKLARAGIGIGASLTAATDQAVRLALHLGIDLVGYARSPRHMVVYTAGHRLAET